MRALNRSSHVIGEGFDLIEHGDSATRDSLLTSIMAWCEKSDIVQALIQTGSLARKDGTADGLSDIDVEIITSVPSALMANDDWLHQIGEVITVLRLHPEDGQEWATRLAIYSGGVKVDFTLAGIERVRSMIDARALDPLYERGYRILLDKSGVTTDLPAATCFLAAPALPRQAEFRALVEEFWFEAFHVPKYLARGELWLVKQRDWAMKELLLRMIEWHASIRNSGSIDTWHLGTRMHEWTDRETRAELQGIFGRFDAADALRAFEATTKLFGRLGREFARTANLEYPQRVEDQIANLNKSLLD
jgi:aminoglycoside 6-adenylyltransferase